MNLKVFENILFNSPSTKPGTGGNFATGAMQHVEYHRFLKLDKIAIKIRKIYQKLLKRVSVQMPDQQFGGRSIVGLCIQHSIPMCWTPCAI